MAFPPGSVLVADYIGRQSFMHKNGSIHEGEVAHTPSKALYSP